MKVIRLKQYETHQLAEARAQEKAAGLERERAEIELALASDRRRQIVEAIIAKYHQEPARMHSWAFDDTDQYVIIYD